MMRLGLCSFQLKCKVTLITQQALLIEEFLFAVGIKFSQDN